MAVAKNNKPNLLHCLSLVGSYKISYNSILGCLLIKNCRLSGCQLCLKAYGCNTDRFLSRVKDSNLQCLAPTKLRLGISLQRATRNICFVKQSLTNTFTNFATSCGRVSPRLSPLILCCKFPKQRSKRYLLKKRLCTE